ncbi:MAG: dCTP deaminase [Candidatus Pacebacteria bacterium]|nr:dCTP deaminase [Candidatus Paceibacterota bacterium]
MLSDDEIKKGIENKTILIRPYNEKDLGSNSYDVHLSKFLAVYENHELDAKKHNKIKHFEIPPEGLVLQPNELYLGSTLEYTETFETVPVLEGKSSTGRLGIDIHATAGVGDVGFCGHWTLEISVTKPVRVYADMPIGQILYHKVYGKVNNPYHKKANAKYNEQAIKPKESMMWKNKF